MLVMELQGLPVKGMARLPGSLAPAPPFLPGACCGPCARGGCCRPSCSRLARGGGQMLCCRPSFPKGERHVATLALLGWEMDGLSQACHCSARGDTSELVTEVVNSYVHYVCFV